MKPILLEPTDVLFFRDGRPMSGSLSGHGAAWPLPHVISHAFHAALHRAELEGVHSHRRGRSGHYEETRDRKFGSLTTAGPFPVCTNGEASTWFFPRPLDATVASEQHNVSMSPLKTTGGSNLPAPLKYPVGNQLAPTKESQPYWWSEGAWNAYLGTTQRDVSSARLFFKSDSDFATTEHSYGIGLNPETSSVEEGKFFSASFLRLKSGWKLGVAATAPDKDHHDGQGGNDLISTLIHGQGGHILVGGQQRVCSAKRDESTNDRLPLPLGKTCDFPAVNGKYLVKWALLTPAIFPQINDHAGGWLPSWIEPSDGQVMLLDGPGKNAAKRKRVREGQPIQATLVAAIIGKPLPITGWALPNSTDRNEGGAKSTHLAVPAGSVYYFECDDESAAKALARALNWHGASLGTEILNRRSTLMGEKGFGLGVCGSWNFHPADPFTASPL